MTLTEISSVLQSLKNLSHLLSSRPMCKNITDFTSKVCIAVTCFPLYTSVSTTRRSSQESPSTYFSICLTFSCCNHSQLEKLLCIFLCTGHKHLLHEVGELATDHKSVANFCCKTIFMDYRSKSQIFDQLICGGDCRSQEANGVMAIEPVSRI